MAGRVRLVPSGHAFEVPSGQTILDCALRAGLAVDYGCTSGVCGRCKARVLGGEVEQVSFHDYVLSEAEKLQGYALLCCTTARGEVRIAASEAAGVEEIARQSVAARVHRIERPEADLALLGLRTPRSQVLRFLAGQRAVLTLPAGQRAELPIASCPCDGLNLQFHLRRAADAFSTEVFERLRKGDGATVEGPVGRLTLDEDAGRPIAFLAWDTGFATVKSLVEHALNLELAQPVRLVRAGPGAGAPYLDNLCRSWADVLDAFEYAALRGVQTGDDGARAAAQAVLRGLERPGDWDVYVAGPPRWLAAARDALAAGGVAPARVFAEPLAA